MVEGFGAAGLAEEVIGGFGAEPVGGLGAFAGEEAEVFGLDDQVLIAGFGAHGTIAVGNGDRRRCGNLKRDSAAMTSALVPYFCRLTHDGSLFTLPLGLKFAISPI